MIGVVTPEALKKCPHCHSVDQSSFIVLAGEYKLVDVTNDNAQDISLKVKKCPKCGLILLFEDK